MNSKSTTTKRTERVKLAERLAFAEALKNARKFAKLSQSDAANALDMGRTKYQSYERGEQYPRYDEIKDMCDLFGRAEHYFFPSIETQRKDDIYTKKIDEVYDELHRSNELSKFYTDTLSKIMEQQELILKNQELILEKLDK